MRDKENRNKKNRNKKNRNKKNRMLSIKIKKNWNIQKKLMREFGNKNVKIIVEHYQIGCKNSVNIDIR